MPFRTYEKVKNRNNNFDKSNAAIKSIQRKSKECRETQKNSGGLSFVLLEKGEERHKKNSSGQSLANSFWQRENGMKEMNSTVLSLRFGKTRKIWKGFGKRRRRRSSKRFIHSSSFFGLQRVSTSDQAFRFILCTRSGPHCVSCIFIFCFVHICI